MSYILDALRKSDAERRQGKAPDLGHQVQMIYRPRKKRVPVTVWILALALLVNAVVLVYLFWPEAPVAQAAPEVPEPVTEPAPAAVPKPVAVPEPVEAVVPAVPESPLAEPAFEEAGGQPVIIVPSPSRNESGVTRTQPEGRVPHLVELPLSFQKSVPDLTFNSHIYSSDASASRVMINNQYLRVGDRFSGITVERITEDGVILSRNGQRFRVGTVRDWVSPR
ncbi:MAG TPA: general secretion pathway protein GspB [Marinobacter sp.]|nr:general secretion pathway protein GspB [Marinobacter sp.]